MIGDLKEKVDNSQLLVEQKEIQIMQLIKDKEHLESELNAAQSQVQHYVRQDELSHQIIRQKEEELYQIRAELEENILEKQTLVEKVEELKQMLESEINEHNADREKLQEMDQVIEVCRS